MKPIVHIKFAALIFWSIFGWWLLGSTSPYPILAGPAAIVWIIATLYFKVKKKIHA